ncbi:MAG: hypothetical protein ABSC46_08605 [Candidatus Limnocylindrales bacterium]
MTESRPSNPKASARAAKPASPSKRAAAAGAAGPKAAGPKAAGPKALAPVSKPPSALTPRHPNLGLAPIDATAGYPAAAEKIRSNMLKISAGALEAAVKADPTIRARYDEAALRRLLRDGELLVERLSMCLGSDTVRWLSEYAEWIGPIYRRRGVPLGDLSALCAGIRETVEPMLSPAEHEVATRALEAATAIFKRNGRIAGDRHKRNALWKWMYRGV